MENPRPEKVAIVDEVRQRVAESDAVILTEYRGLSVSALAELRRKLAGVGGEYKVYKNTLVRIATRDIDSSELAELLNGPTALAFVRGDVAEVAKALRDFSRANPELTMKGGLLGNRVFGPSEAQQIASLEPRPVMLAKLAGLLQAPLAQFAGLLQAPTQKFAGLLKALVDAGGAAGSSSVASSEAEQGSDASGSPEAEQGSDASGSPEAEQGADAPLAAAETSDVEEPSAGKGTSEAEGTLAE
jgi:large subunit ribosomal protein L10